MAFELQRVTDGMDLLIEWDDKHQDGRVRAVVYDRPGTAQDATQLAVNLHVPLAVARDLPKPPKT